MSTKTEKDDSRAVSVSFDGRLMLVKLSDGVTVKADTRGFERLSNASPEQLRKAEIRARGTGIHWEELDEDLSVSGLVRDFGTKKAQQKRSSSNRTHSSQQTHHSR